MPKKSTRRGRTKQRPWFTLLFFSAVGRCFQFGLIFLAAYLSLSFLGFYEFLEFNALDLGRRTSGLSSKLYAAFGVGAAVLPLAFLFAAWKLSDRVPEFPSEKLARFLAFVSLLPALSLFMSSVFGARFGGDVGSAIGGYFIPAVGEAGTALFAALLAYFALRSIFQGFSYEDLLDYCYELGSWAIYCCYAAYDFLCYVCGSAVRVVSAIIDFLRASSESVSEWFSGCFESLSERLSFRSEPEPEKKAKPKIKVRPKKKKKVVAAAEPEEVPIEEDLLADDSALVKKAQEKTFKVERFEPQPIAKQTEIAFEEDETKDYVPPTTDLLDYAENSKRSSEDESYLRKLSVRIEEKLADFNVKGSVTRAHAGPVVTMFEFEPAPGVKVGKIASLQDDLSMSLRASSIRIIAPIPQRGTVGIEIPNRGREIVTLRELLEADDKPSSKNLRVPLGKDIYGKPAFADVAKMPHLLMAGATGTGKSVSINAFLISLLYRSAPEELGLILIDPKILELSVYENIPHLKVPVVTDPKRAKAVLRWAATEMDRRYRLMKRFGVRSIDGYNSVVDGSSNIPGKAAPEESKDGSPKEELERLPKIVIVIDELADLMLTVGKEVEDLITRLAQKARAAGIHLIVATQRPSVDVITGLIKANFPARLSFRVSSRIDSRTILDGPGAEKLLGNGDMLFVRPGALHPERLHGAFVSDEEVNKVVAHLRDSSPPRFDQEIMETIEKELQSEKADSGAAGDGSEDYDALYDQALELVMRKGQASTSMIQRAFRIGYNRAARIVDVMEREGIVGPVDGAKPREVLVQSSIVEQDEEEAREELS